MADDLKLRSGTPVWDSYTRPRIASSPLTRDLETDILIVGAGISGAMMAEAISEHGLRIIVVDKDKPLHGSTPASTALLQYELDQPLCLLKQKVGWKNAVRGWQRSKLGLESLAVKIKNLKIDCDFERRDSLYLAGDLLDTALLKQESALRDFAGLPSQFLSSKDLMRTYGIRAKGALIARDNIACNPVNLATGFLKKAQTNGAKLYHDAEIVKLDRRKHHIDAITAEGRRIRAKDVVFTTGYAIPDFIRTGHYSIRSTYALATKPVSGIDAKLPFIWEASKTYCYGRTTMDGRMIFGGGDEDFKNEEKRDAILPEKISMLEKRMRGLFPDYLFETDSSWCGSFGSSGTGLPFLGRIPNVPHCYAVMGFGGNGITFSRIAADMITAQILGHEDPDADLFSLKSA